MTTASTPLRVSSDGSCLRNPDGPIGWSWVTEKGAWSSNGYHTGTNQRAELLGVISVLRAFRDTPIILELDSEYALKLTSLWIHGWARNGWRKKTAGPIQNLDLVKMIHRELGRRTEAIDFEWVRGHQAAGSIGAHLNQEADLHAGEASRRAREVVRAHSSLTARARACADLHDSSGGGTSAAERQLISELIADELNSEEATAGLEDLFGDVLAEVPGEAEPRGRYEDDRTYVPEPEESPRRARDPHDRSVEVSYRPDRAAIEAVVDAVLPSLRSRLIAELTLALSR